MSLCACSNNTNSKYSEPYIFKNAYKIEQLDKAFDNGNYELAEQIAYEIKSLYPDSDDSIYADATLNLIVKIREIYK